jgi:hypothetical protein
VNKRRLIVAAVPIILVNIIAFSGQLAFLREHLSWPLPGVIMFAAALESIALYLAFMSHEALMAEDASFRLRMGSYAVAFTVGLMNYSHYSPHGPTFIGLATGFMSAASPALWGIYSRRNSRDALKAKGLIESRTVKFGGARWFWWPIRTFPVFRHAVWTGETDPAAAVAQYESERAATEPSEPRMSLATVTTQADAVRVALRDSDLTAAPEIATWLAARGWPAISPAYIRQIRSIDGRKDASERRSGIRAVTGHDNRPAITSQREADQGK